MYVEKGDWVPPSPLQVNTLTTAEILGGVGGTLALVGILLLYFVLHVVMGVDLGWGDDDAPTPILEEEEVIAARFVRKGIDFEERLPNREVPQLSTTPPEGTAISENPRENTEPPPDAGPPPPDNATEDLLRRLGDRAQIFAEITEERDVEGDAEGIEDGTESAAEGDLYAGQLYVFFRRGWTVPTTISDGELRDLRVSAMVTIDESLRLTDFRLRGTSGNADFDQSVTAQLERIRTMGLEVPEPPIDRRTRFIGTPVRLDFTGRQAGR